EGVNDNDSDELSIEERRVDSILNIAEDTKQLHIIGPSGSGKSTTLHKIRYINSSLALNEAEEVKIPILLYGNEYHPNHPIRSMLSSILDDDSSERLLKEGRIQLLFDGLNEINEDYKFLAYKDIQNF